MTLCFDILNTKNRFGIEDVNERGIHLIRVPIGTMPFNKCMELCDSLQESFNHFPTRKAVFIPDSKCKTLNTEFISEDAVQIVDFNLPPFPSLKREKIAIMLKSRIRKVNKTIKFIVFVNA